MSVNKLSVYHCDNAVYDDLTESVREWTRGSGTLDYTKTVDYLYVGRDKAFNALWFELTTPNVTAATLTLEYYNGTAWTALAVDLDDTQGLTRSGWIRWTKPTDIDEVAINSATKVWIRFSWSATFSPACVIATIGLVFSDDQMLKEEVPNILTNYLPTGCTSHILSHVAAKKRIMQRLRSQVGLYKVSQSTGDPKDIDEWDMHDIDQMQAAAKFLTLAIIFGNASDEDGDGEAVKKKEFLVEYERSFKVALLSIDTDDDGQESSDEKAGSNMSVRLSR